METYTERAKPICEGCGIGLREVDEMIDGIALSSLEREQAIELWKKTYEGPADRSCLPRVEAIVDAGMANR